MKKFSITLIFMAGFGLSTFSQSFKNISLAPKSNASRNGTMAQQNPNPVLLKNGHVSAITSTFSDDFSLPNDTTGLKARGYLAYYRGTGPQGITATWFQGSLIDWADFNNDTNEYVCSNFNSVTLTNNIDNWLVLPSLNVDSGDQISFYSRSPFNSVYADSIRVMYSGVGDSIPEDTTWIELGRFKVNINGDWEQNIFIAPSTGAAARFAIRYAVSSGGPGGVNSDLIGIDQLDVYKPAAFDVQAISVDALSKEYTQIPFSQVSNLLLNGLVKNTGANPTTGGIATFELVDASTSAPVFSDTINLPNMAFGASFVISKPISYTPSIAAFYKIRLTLTLPGDGNTSNDTVESGISHITNSVYARDIDSTTGAIGVGAGSGLNGIIGQNFNVINQANLTSVSFYMTSGFNPGSAGTPVWGSIHSQSQGGVPSDTILATTDTVLIIPGTITPPGIWLTLPIPGPPLTLNPGLYFAGVHEYDSLLSIGTSSGIISSNSVWISWDSMPAPPAVDGWAKASDFGVYVALQLRLNLTSIPMGIQNNETGSSIIIYPNPSTGLIYLNNQTVNPSDYSVKVFNSLGQEAYSSMFASFTNATIDLSFVSSGIYHIQLTGGSTTINKAISISKN